jgi:splicing factor U2AF subunit
MNHHHHHHNNTGSNGGAVFLARNHGTEQDEITCPFYYKVGACRHMQRCQRLHVMPLFSTTVLIHGMWKNPRAPKSITQEEEEESIEKNISQQQLDVEFKEFFDEIFEEFAKFGEIEDIAVVENTPEHHLGNVMITYFQEDDAAKCVQEISGRMYDGKLLVAEFSPVSDLEDAKCRQMMLGRCNRGLTCSFVHDRRLPNHDHYLKNLLRNQPHYHPERRQQQHHHHNTNKQSPGKDHHPDHYDNNKKSSSIPISEHHVEGDDDNQSNSNSSSTSHENPSDNNNNNSSNTKRVKRDEE